MNNREISKRFEGMTIETLHVGEKGLAVVFEGGTRILISVTIETKANSNGYLKMLPLLQYEIIED